MNFYKTNPCLLTDAYKVVHWKQRPENMTTLYSYGEPRSGGKNRNIVFVGLQPILQEYFMNVPTKEQIDIAEQTCYSTFGTTEYFNRDVWEKVNQLGYYPIKIKAVKEGTILPESNVCFTIESTKDWFAPMISHFEDALMWCWYSSAVATRGLNLYTAIEKEMIKSSSKVVDLIMPFAVNDFGLRGATFEQGAIMGGMSHLVFFDGTDNLPAIDGIRQYYGDSNIGKSVWATEHSVATSFGPNQGEFEYVNTQLDNAPDTATISIVIDSYDAHNFIKNIIGSKEIKDKIISRKGRTVFRPDSGEPIINLIKFTELLANIFGYGLNSDSYKVINHNVGLIQGDGMTEESIPTIYKEYTQTGWASENFITGSGGGLLVENLTRDTQRWAIKASYAVIDGKEVDLRKTPATDTTKSSKCGKLKLHKTGDNKFTTLESSKERPEMFGAYIDELRVVFEDGVLENEQSFSDIRRTAQFYKSKL